jgi:inosine-uridine nucleoside N-ribohydrolase
LTTTLTMGSATASPAASKPDVPAIIFDGDMDFDDAAALAYLCQAHKQHRIDLRAVTVTNDGVGTPGRALTHVRTELERCGLTGIPVAEGAPTGVNPPPPDARTLFEKVLTAALGDGDRPDKPSAIPAWQLIAGTVLDSRAPVAVLSTGPLTNVARALDVPGVASHISRMSVMGGAFTVPGNLFGPDAGRFDGTQEVNMWLDPASAAHVFATMPAGHVEVVPLDATDDVPITPSFVDKIGTGTSGEAKLVHAVLTYPDLTPLIAAGDILFWWDTLAAENLVAGESPVSLREAAVAVRQDGTAAGRTEVATTGPVQHIGFRGDRKLFEESYFTTLDGG